MASKRNPVSDAIRSLRQAIGESQQAFAFRMKTAIRTIARWESGRPPHGKTLVELQRLASERRLSECAQVFQRALKDELGGYITPKELFQHSVLAYMGARHGILPFDWTEEELHHVLALRKVFREPNEYRRELKVLKKTLRGPVAEVKDVIAANDQQVELRYEEMIEARKQLQKENTK